MKITVFIFVFLACNVCFAGDMTVSTQNEIDHLFTFIKSSDCMFYRNGKWYPARDAADHIDKKYRYLLKRGKISSVEKFIDLSATKSSMSGKKYKVKCGKSNEIASSVWLYKELLEYRSGKISKRTCPPTLVKSL